MFTLADSVKYPELNEPSDLTFDHKTSRLYWINLASGLMQYFSKDTKTVLSLKQNGFSNRNFFGLAVYNDHIYYGINETLYRRKLSEESEGVDEPVTSSVAGAESVVIYNRRSARSNSCAQNTCAHLCLPVSVTESKCACAEGYSLDTSDNAGCIAAPAVLMYSTQRGLNGLNILPSEELGIPLLSKLGAISRIAADAQRGLFVIADSEAGTITQMWRDGTNRKVLVKGANIMDIAVDRIAGNVYWSGGNSISVCRFNDTRQYIVVHDIGQPDLLAVHPGIGILLWSDISIDGGIYIANLDGSNPLLIVPSNNSKVILGLEVDVDENRILWSDGVSKRIMSSDLDGKHMTVVVEGLMHSPSALAVDSSRLYFSMGR